MHVSFAFIFLIVLLVAGGGIAVLVMALVAGGRKQSHHNRERSEKICAEIERVEAMQADGRITSDEAAELREALGDQHPSGGGESSGTKRLTKSASPFLAGVCGGLADWLGWDPTLMRIAFALITFLVAGFPGVLVYIILALIMPAHPESQGSSGRSLVVLAALMLVPLMLLFLFLALFVVRCRPVRTVEPLHPGIHAPAIPGRLP